MNKLIRYIKFKIILAAITVFVGGEVGHLIAQQDPMFTQYMFNTLTINPAYAGSREMLSLMVLGRQQWVGFEGAPTTATFTGHLPVYKNMAMGASLIYDTYGPVNQTSFFIDYAYHLKMSDKLKMSLGLNGGFNNYAIDFIGLDKTYSNDESYYNANEQTLLSNFGFGVYLYSQRFYLGLSVPRIMENSFEEGAESYGNGNEVRHYYGMMGVVFHLNDHFVLRPSVMTRLAQGSPFSVDLNVNTVLYDKFWIGAMYRLNESLGGILQFQINKQIRFGYAFDLNTNQLSSYHSGSHELMINYEFNFNKERVINPRYF